MEEIFIISENHNDSDIYYQHLGFLPSKEDAEKEVERLKNVYAKLCIFKDDLNKKVSNFRLANFPEMEKFLEYPKWPSGLSAGQITVEMKKERETIKGKNEMIEHRNKIKEEAFNKKLYDFTFPIYQSASEEIKKIFLIRENIICQIPWGACDLNEKNPYVIETMKKYQS